MKSSATRTSSKQPPVMRCRTTASRTARNSGSISSSSRPGVTARMVGGRPYTFRTSGGHASRGRGGERQRQQYPLVAPGVLDRDVGEVLRNTSRRSRSATAGPATKRCRRNASLRRQPARAPYRYRPQRQPTPRTPRPARSRHRPATPGGSIPASSCREVYARTADTTRTTPVTPPSHRTPAGTPQRSSPRARPCRSTRPPAWCAPARSSASRGCRRGRPSTRAPAPATYPP
jgi:hypothetical protein